MEFNQSGNRLTVVHPKLRATYIQNYEEKNIQNCESRSTKCWMCDDFYIMSKFWNPKGKVLLFSESFLPLIIVFHQRSPLSHMHVVNICCRKISPLFVSPKLKCRSLTEICPSSAWLQFTDIFHCWLGWEWQPWGGSTNGEAGVGGGYGDWDGVGQVNEGLTRWLCNWEMTKYEIYRVLFRYC